MIYTIGYSGLSIEDLELAVVRFGIDRIFDVRSYPYSRRPEFNRNRLLKRFGERYIWMGEELGGKEGPVSQHSIKRLAAVMDTVLLLCMEAHPCDCHRLYDIGLKLRRMDVATHHIVKGNVYTIDQIKEERKCRRHRIS